MSDPITTKGGEGSGNFDHAGIPGRHGGSAPSRSASGGRGPKETGKPSGAGKLQYPRLDSQLTGNDHFARILNPKQKGAAARELANSKLKLSSLRRMQDDMDARSRRDFPKLSESDKKPGAARTPTMDALDEWEARRAIVTAAIDFREFPPKKRGKKEFVGDGSISVFKDAQGRFRWISISSNAFKDQDQEIVSTKALDDDCARADLDLSYGPLRWWHVPNLDVGDCDFNMMSGRMLIESGTFRDERVGQVLKEAPGQYQISLGFKHPATEPDRDGVFHMIRRFERSLLPAGRASNQLTAFLVKGESMATTKEDKLKAFTELLGDEALAKKFLGEAERTEKAAEERGVAYKAKNDKLVEKPARAKPKDEAPEPEEEETKPEADAKPEAQEADGDSDELDALLAELEGEEEDEGDESEAEEEVDEEEPVVSVKKPLAKKEAEQDQAEKELPTFLGDIPTDDFAELMAGALAGALEPYFVQLKGIAEAVTAVKEGQVLVEQKLKELGEARSEKETKIIADVEAVVTTSARVVAELEKLKAATTIQAQALVKDKNRLDALEGATTKAAKGYIASQADETVQAEDSRLKDAGPKADPIASFTQAFVLGNTGLSQ